MTADQPPPFRCPRCGVPMPYADHEDTCWPCDFGQELETVAKAEASQAGQEAAA